MGERVGMQSLVLLSRSRWSSAVWIVLTLLLTGFFSPAHAAGEPVEIAREYLKAWQDGNPRRMYDLLDRRSKEAISLPQFTAAFTVRLPFSAVTHILKPVSFRDVKPRQGAPLTIDYTAEFSVESLLGPEACEVFCRDRRLSLTLPQTREARLRALYLLYDSQNAQSKCVSVRYVLGLSALVVAQDMMWFLPGNAGRGSSVLGLGRLRSDTRLVINTASSTWGDWQVSASSLALRVAPIRISEEGGVVAPLEPLKGPEPTVESEPTQEAFDILLSLVGLADP